MKQIVRFKTPQMPAAPSMNGIARSCAARGIILLAVLNIVLQFFWFGRYTLSNIDFDGISYLGIARHVSEGNFRASINGFRSPLFSWLLALLLPFGTNPLLVGKIMTIATFVASATLLYAFTYSLWKSEVLAAIALFWFSAGRGIVLLPTQFVTPDFLLSFLVLIYFMILLRCLRGRNRSDWVLLGAIHALAFLAKAIALPWLAATTLAATLLAFPKRIRERLLCLLLAGLFPLIVAAGWATVLHLKYGVLTTGSQFRVNLLQWTLHETPDASEPSHDYMFLRDMTRSLDRYMVHDPMPPGATGWRYELSLAKVAPKVLAAETRNLPPAIKESFIVLTPGGVLAFCIGLMALTRKPGRYVTEFRLTLIVAFGSAALILAYCMLVFDERYILPIVPLILAVAVGVLVRREEESEISPAWRATAILLAFAGIAFAVCYWGSPFRTLDRDFQSACHNAGEKLESHPGQTVVSLGSGPYPTHGVGWESGFKAAFFGNRQLVAYSDNLPNLDKLPQAIADVLFASPDAVMLWGTPLDPDYLRAVGYLAPHYRVGAERISDPANGEVGTIFFRENNP